MSDAPDSTRGLVDRGTSRTSARERNVRRGEVHAVVPDHTYNVVGFDIGSADLSKPGIKEQLEPVIQQIQARMGQPRHPIIRVTGHASESRLPGKGPEHYAQARSGAVADYLVSRGIPRGWIVTDTSRADPSRGAAGREASPEAKAWARAATLEIGSSEDRRDVADRFGDITYFKQKPRFQLPDIHAPELGPILKRVGKGVHDPEPSKDRPDDPTGVARLFGVAATGVSLAATGMASLAAGTLMLGKEVGSLEELENAFNQVFQRRAQSRVPRDDKALRDRFIRQCLANIAQDPHHPLRKLVDPSTGKFKGRQFFSIVPAVHAGHTISLFSGVDPLFALEDPVFNAALNVGESVGVVFWKPAKLIGGVPVEFRTAAMWERLGMIDKGTVGNSPWTIGWEP